MTFKDPGELRHEVTVEHFVITKNDDGTVTRDWAPISPNPIRVKIEPLSGQELIEAQTLAANARFRVSGYRVDGLEPKKWRFRYGARKLNVLHVKDEMEIGFKMECLCGEIL